ncbi:lipopolysaccharide biosynthesis protein [Pseudarthrobacter sp. NPDC058196]|uniref:lipopolysaccharide biosynthesis protein n=1 Tax=Pseudarthrobacter sp. NPDC058196 TaxID=3346376 RepID=UPI0036DF504E
MQQTRERIGSVSRRKGVGFQAIALASSTGLSQLIVALLYIWTARSTAPADFGLLIAGIAMGTAAVGFVDFGTNSMWTRELATGRMEPFEHGRRLSGKLIVTAALATIWVLSTLHFMPATYAWVAGPVAMSTLLNQSFQVSLRGEARGDLVSLSILGDRLMALAAFAALTLTGSPAVQSLWISLTAGSLVATLSGWFLTPAEKRPILRLSRNTNPWLAAGHYGLSNVAFSAQSLDTPIMTAVSGASTAGVYGAVARWTQPMGLLANAFSSAAAPHMARAETTAAAWNHIKRSVWLPATAVLTCIIIAATAPFLVNVLIGNQYEESVHVLQVLALGTIPAIVNQPLFVFLQARGLDKSVAFLATSVVFVQLALVAVLASVLGALGAAVAAAGSQLVLLLGLGILTRKLAWSTRPPA